MILRPRVVELAMVIAFGVVAVAAGGVRAQDPDLKAPVLLAPGSSVVAEAGSPTVFRIRTHARDVGLVLRVSRTSVRGKCGVIGGEVLRQSFVRTGVATIYEARPPGATLSNSWLNTPGTYFWQAYRIGGRDGCVESAVRRFQIAPRTPLSLAEARLEGTFDVTTRITAVSGFSIAVGDTDEVTYTLTPGCGAGACDTTLGFGVSGIVPGLPTKVNVPLTRTDAVYAGSGQASLSKCGFFNVDGTLELRLEVSSGAWFGTSWRATGVVGHTRYSTPEASGGVMQTCPPASWEADLTGTLRGSAE